MVYIMNNAPCKGNTLIIRLLPLQGVGGVWVPFTQGAALGYVLLPLRGVLFMSFDTPSFVGAVIKLYTHYIIYKHNKKVAATSILSEKSSKFAELTATF